MSMSPVKLADAAAAASASLATGALAAAWLDLVAKGLAITASIIAIIAGLYAIRVHRRNLRK